MRREDLIEAVAEVIDDQYDDYSPQYNAEGVCVSSGLAVAAVDAVLSAVADDLDRFWSSEWDRIKEEEGRVFTDDGLYLDGIAISEERIRSLTSQEERND